MWEIAACFTLPITVVFFILADSIVNVVIGPQWLPAVPAIKVLVVASFLSSLVKMGGSLFNGYGIPRKYMEITLLQTLITAALIYPLINVMGLEGAAYSVLVVTAAAIPLMLFQLVKHLSFKVLEITKALAIPVVMSLVIWGANIGLGAFLGHNTVLGLIGYAFLNLSIFTGLSYVVWRMFRKGPFQIVMAIKDRS
jgi:O-antigen/teichoic acid export membrane protein